ncbi:WD40 repeat domain-containing protein [Nocardiopsis sp. NPDC007018]|uniref:WD40 repeat domain-containing protein n=1 Tax=Nocardiopsis sp. NPDC007018 TaxID=3155721 RepID=UPI0033C8AF04
MRSSLTLVAAALLALAPAVPAVAATADPEDGTGGFDYPRGSEGPEGSEIAFEFQDDRISESSGLAPSLLHEGVWWTHNDSGDHPSEVYAVNEDGETVATVTLNVERRDWEAISVAQGPDGVPAVFVGDIGDNFGGGWPSVRVYHFTEPEVLGDSALDPSVFTFTYEDGGRDAEGMMIDPRNGRLYVVSKEFAGSVYVAPENLDPVGENVLTRVDSAPLFATDAAFSPDGTRYAIRTYWGVSVYDGTNGVPGRPVGSFDLPEMDQGESVAFTPDGSALMAGSEGANSPVWRVPLSGEQLPEMAADTEDAAEASPVVDESAAEEPEEADAGGALPLILGGAAVAVVLIGAIVLLVRRT